MTELVHVERTGAHAVVTIDHPRANAISAAVIEQLEAALTDVERDARVRAIVLTGAGDRFFAAGADVSEFPAAAALGRAASGGQALTLQLETTEKPIIAAINGMALGGGLEIAMACDLRVAASTARLGQPELNLGLIPGWGGTQRLPRIVGRGHAAYLLYTGEPIDAAHALRIGLVNQVVAPEELPGAAAALAETLAAKAPLALAATKRALTHGLDRPLDEALTFEAEEFAELFHTADGKEGVAAYLEKRAPVWTGR